MSSLEDSVFAYCHALQSIEIPKNITKIGNSAFNYCVSLESISIPSEITSIGHGAFCNCSSLETVIFQGNKLVSIGYYAFSNCVSLKSISFPKSLRSLEHNVFEGCKSLQDITLPRGLEYIGDYAFSQCQIFNVVIPSTVTKVGKYAFDGLVSLSSVTICCEVSSKPSDWDNEWCWYYSKATIIWGYIE